jgi:predicted MFS family arabinose efflux permease
MSTSGEAQQRLEEAPAGLTIKGIPVDPNLRILGIATLVNTFGNGALMTTFALYFTRVVGLRPTQVALAVSAGALAGLLVQVPAGHFADVRGPRKVLQTLTFGAGVALLGLLLARSLWALMAVMAVIAVFDRGAQAVRNGYVARLAEGGQRVQFKAYLRAVTNVGISLGALSGGLALWVDQGWAYLAVFADDPGPDFFTRLHPERTTRRTIDQLATWAIASRSAFSKTPPSRGIFESVSALMERSSVSAGLSAS